MFIQFSGVHTTMDQLRADMLAASCEVDPHDGDAPSLYLFALDRVTHSPHWVECRRGTDGNLSEKRIEDLLDVGLGSGVTYFETLDGVEYSGQCVAIWVTATSRYMYRLYEYHRFGGDPKITHQRWHYSGPLKGFRSQKFLPATIQGVVKIFAAYGTYGRFNTGNGGCPLEAYQATKAAWEAPFMALTGQDSVAAAASWKARHGLMAEPAALEALFRGLKESAAAERRRLRQLRKEKRTADDLPVEVFPEG